MKEDITNLAIQVEQEIQPIFKISKIFAEKIVKKY